MSSQDVGEDGAVAAVRAGLNVRPDFWDDFLRVIGGPGIPELLDVPGEKVAKWAESVRKGLDAVRKADDGEAAGAKARTLRTGDEIAGDDGVSGREPPDLRPLP